MKFEASWPGELRDLSVRDSSRGTARGWHGFDGPDRDNAFRSASAGTHVHLVPWHLPFSGTRASGRVDEVTQVEGALRVVLQRLSEAGLQPPDERAVRRHAEAALKEACVVQPQRRRLRQLLHRVSSALVAGTASNGSGETVQELLRMLQRAGVF